MWLSIAILLYLRTKNESFQSKTETIEIKIDSRVDVKKITVIDGNTYDLVLNDSKLDRVLVSLSVKATTDSKNKVIELLNVSSSPRVVLKTKMGDLWLAEIFFTNNGKEQSISEWLVQNNLVYK